MIAGCVSPEEGARWVPRFLRSSLRPKVATVPLQTHYSPSCIRSFTGCHQERETFVSAVTFIFSVPFLLLSMPGGWLADRFSKRGVTIWTKVMELGSMLVATAGLVTHSLPLCLAALALVASQAALFGPTKYALLPELLPEKSLSWGNGVIELGTFLAIIVGTVAGAAMAEEFHGHEMYAGYALLGLAGAGWLTSLGIDNVPAAAPHKAFRANVLKDLFAQVRLIRKDRALFLALLGNTYFWFLGSLLFSTIVVYGPDVLHVGQTKTGYLNATLAVGIGIGSMAAGWLSDNKIEYGLTPLGSIGMTCTGLILGLLPNGLVCSALLLGILGFWAGFFAVPVNALIQHRPAADQKGGIIAAANLLSFVGIAISSGVYFVFTQYIHLDPRGVIVAASLITAASTVYLLMLLPEWFARLILFFVTRTLYRIQVVGRDNFPEKTGALLVQPHVVCRRGAAGGGHRSPHPLHHVPGHLRPPHREAFRRHHEGHSDFERTASEGNDPLAACRHPGVARG
jgi:acyl-[acyl-carrier-protein]-phospholipid O-acyltransferase/long-chain-fatty-acid--[acyl-carrier-protein] ligase